MVRAHYPLVAFSRLERGYPKEVGPQEADDLRVGLLDLLSTVIGDINLCGTATPPNQPGSDRSARDLSDQTIVWGKEQQLCLDEIKKYLVNPPVLIPPQQGKPFRLYLSTDGMVIGSALIQEFEGKERVIYYLSRRLVDAETRYSAIEKLCLCLYFSCIKALFAVGLNARLFAKMMWSDTCCLCRS